MKHWPPFILLAVSFVLYFGYLIWIENWYQNHPNLRPPVMRPFPLLEYEDQEYESLLPSTQLNYHHHYPYDRNHR